MKPFIKFAIASTLIIAVSSQVIAGGVMKGKEGHPQRPSFETLDANEDGMIEFSEFSSHKIPHGDHQTIFDRIDTDKSGVLSLKEYVNHKPPHPRKRKE